MEIIKKSVSYNKVIFWSIVVWLLYMSYEWGGSLIISVYSEAVTLFDIPMDAVAGSLSGFLDTVSSLVLTCVYLILAIFIVKKRPADIKMKFTLSIPFCIVIALGAGGMSAVWLNFAENFLTGIPFVGKSLDYFSTLYDDIESGAYIWSLLSLSIIGPIVEEILFRLLIFNSLERISGSPWFAVIVSGVLFGIWHMIFIQSVYTAIMGCVLGFVYYKTRNIYITIFIHIINNFMFDLPPAINTDFVINIIDILKYVMIIPAACILYMMYKKKYEDNNYLVYEKRNKTE